MLPCTAGAKGQTDYTLSTYQRSREMIEIMALVVLLFVFCGGPSDDGKAA